MKSQRWIKCGDDEDEVDMEGEDADVDEMMKDERNALEEQHGEGGDNYIRTLQVVSGCSRTVMIFTTWSATDPIVTKV